MRAKNKKKHKLQVIEFIYQGFVSENWFGFKKCKVLFRCLLYFDYIFNLFKFLIQHLEVCNEDMILD